MYNRAKAETANRNMTMEQHTAMMILAKYRHSLHCSEDIVTGTEKKMKVFTEVIPRMLMTVGLPGLRITFSPTTGNHHDAESSRKVIEEVNSEIEGYMGLIDMIYGTTYRPSGYLRQMFAERNALTVTAVPA